MYSPTHGIEVLTGAVSFEWIRRCGLAITRAFQAADADPTRLLLAEENR
jgi:hypothetical protein